MMPKLCEVHSMEGAKYLKDVELMMFGFGDVHHPLPETVELVSEIVHTMIRTLVLGIIEDVGPSEAATIEDIIYMIREDSGRVARLRNHLRITRDSYIAESPLIVDGLHAVAGVEDIEVEESYPYGKACTNSDPLRIPTGTDLGIIGTDGHAIQRLWLSDLTKELRDRFGEGKIRSLFDAINAQVVGNGDLDIISRPPGDCVTGRSDAVDKNCLTNLSGENAEEASEWKKAREQVWDDLVERLTPGMLEILKTAYGSRFIPLAAPYSTYLRFLEWLNISLIRTDDRTSQPIKKDSIAKNPLAAEYDRTVMADSRNVEAGEKTSATRSVAATLSKSPMHVPMRPSPLSQSYRTPSPQTLPTRVDFQAESNLSAPKVSTDRVITKEDYFQRERKKNTIEFKVVDDGRLIVDALAYLAWEYTGMVTQMAIILRIQHDLASHRDLGDPLVSETTPVTGQPALQSSSVEATSSTVPVAPITDSKGHPLSHGGACGIFIPPCSSVSSFLRSAPKRLPPSGQMTLSSLLEECRSVQSAIGEDGKVVKRRAVCSAAHTNITEGQPPLRPVHILASVERLSLCSPELIAAPVKPFSFRKPSSSLSRMSVWH
eukprot:Rmarinus@m.8222